MAGTSKDLKLHDIKLLGVVRAEYARWLAAEQRGNSQESIEAFAMHITQNDTGKFFGHGLLDVIEALGGKKPSHW